MQASQEFTRSYASVSLRNGDFIHYRKEHVMNRQRTHSDGHTREPDTITTLMYLIAGAVLLGVLFWFSGSVMGFGAGWEGQIDSMPIPPTDVR